MPATQALVGVTDPYDARQSLTGSAKYWQILRADPLIGDNPELLVAAYNAGPEAVHTAKGIPPFHETQQHVRAVRSYLPRYQGMAGSAQGGNTQTPPQPLSPASVQGIEAMLSTARRWSAILAAWYDMGGELFSGTITVRGHPAWNIGHRLVSSDARGDWEAYIEGVTHTYDMRTGRYLTQLRITRGWYLSEANADEIWSQGQTQITGTTGGPPEVDPASQKEVLIAFPGIPGFETPH
jgi:hypothetical protein